MYRGFGAVIILALMVVLSACGSVPASSTAISKPQSTAQASASQSVVAESKLPEDAKINSFVAPVGAVDDILGGFSAKSFKDGKVSDDVIHTILQCGQKAPSARNLQPWHFTVISDDKIAKSLIRVCPDGGVVIVVSGAAAQSNGMDVSFDCGLATQNMYIAAQSLGLGAHLYISGVQEANNARGTLGIPDGYEAKVLLLVGHLGDKVDAVTSASKRNPLDDIVNYIRGE